MPLFISPREANRLVTEERAILIDVRDPDEYRRIRIPGSRLQPLPALAFLPEDEDKERPAIYFCWSGNRTASNSALLDKRGHATVYIIEGGLSAWEKAGLPLERHQDTLPLMRQVHLGAGGLILLSLLLAQAWGGFYLVTAFIGAGLAFSGLTGWCGMSLLLARMPWNKKRN